MKHAVKLNELDVVKRLVDISCISKALVLAFNWKKQANSLV